MITHQLHADNAQGDAGIGYAIIIVSDLMVQLGLKDNIGRQILECDETVIPMKELEKF